jgi:hypothetical protein
MATPTMTKKAKRKKPHQHTKLHLKHKKNRKEKDLSSTSAGSSNTIKSLSTTNNANISRPTIVAVKYDTNDEGVLLEISSTTITTLT